MILIILCLFPYVGLNNTDYPPPTVGDIRPPQGVCVCVCAKGSLLVVNHLPSIKSLLKCVQQYSWLCFV